MGRIFIWAERRVNAKETTTTQPLILLRDQVVTELRSTGCEVFAVPDELSLSAAIQWINERSRQGDVALAIEANASASVLRGTSVFYIANNIERKKHAELILLLLVRRLPQILSRGSKPDTVTALGNFSFLSSSYSPSLLLEISLFSNLSDLEMLMNQQRTIALGLADGLIAWSREVSGVEPNQIAFEPISAASYSSINISLNNQLYDEPGILINGNAYLPIDLVDRLGIDLIQSWRARVQEQGVVYIKAIELRDYNISVTWDYLSQTVVLRSNLLINRKEIDTIMSQGNTSEVQLIMFLKSHYENALKEFSDLAKIYREEGLIEGVNYDIAFCQMCLETDFLRFGEKLQASDHNFASLGAKGIERQWATFPNSRLGVRAQIQHLKAYASLEPLVQEVVDPRFHSIARGIANRVTQLSGRWSADLTYGNKILAMLRRLYESANIL